MQFKIIRAMFIALFFINSSYLIASTNSDVKPNVLLIVADDLGYADLGSFGSEIPTPNLDQLANSGVKFSNFITSSVCSPSRAALLTGASPHQIGFGNLAEELAPNQQGQPGYEGFLNDKALTIATLFSDAGYATMMTGKWHLGKKLEHSPKAKGFQRSFAMLNNASHFSDMRPAYSPDPQAKALYREDEKMLDALPDNFTYSSQFYVDQLMNYIDESGDKPFFAMLSFAAPHWPLQAPDKAIIQFRDKYNQGYQSVAKQRFQKQKALGLLPENAKMAATPQVKDWQQLTEQEQKVEARSMEVYAAMVNEIDTHSGRLFEHLKEQGKFENTIVLFISDNGAEGHNLDSTWPADMFPKIRKTIDESHDFSYENMGRKNSYTLYGAGWAHASAPSYFGYKGSQSEGGVRTAAFVYAPHILKQQDTFTQNVTIRDIPVTLLDMAGLQHPGNTYKGKTYAPVIGESVFQQINQTHQTAAKVYVDETMGKISVRLHEWKLTRMPAPYGNNNWQLFNLKNDLAESVNLAEKHPDRVKVLLNNWHTYKQQNNVILPNWVSGY